MRLEHSPLHCAVADCCRRDARGFLVRPACSQVKCGGSLFFFMGHSLRSSWASSCVRARVRGYVRAWLRACGRAEVRAGGRARFWGGRGGGGAAWLMSSCVHANTDVCLVVWHAILATPIRAAGCWGRSALEHAAAEHARMILPAGDPGMHGGVLPPSQPLLHNPLTVSWRPRDTTWLMCGRRFLTLLCVHPPAAG